MVVLYDRKRNRTSEARLDLRAGKVVSWTPRVGAQAPVLRPDGPDTRLTVRGDGTIRVRTSRGTIAVTVPSYGYRVEQGVFRTRGG